MIINPPMTTNINIMCGQHVIETATITSINDVVINVTCHGDRHLLVRASTVETLRKFWCQEYQRLGWSRSWAECVMTAVSNVLVDPSTPHVDEDHWIDSAHDDRHSMPTWDEQPMCW